MDTLKLDLERKIAQLVMPRIDFNDPGSLELAEKLVKEAQVGGFIIFGGTSGIIRKAAQELQSESVIPLFFACDAERGVGQIVSDMTLFPFTMSLGAIRDPELVYKQASLIAEEMKECGMNIVFGPVADINTNPENPIINIRSYGDSPTLVSSLSEAFIRGLQDNGILACAKHFPGHGGTGVDSHLDMPVSDQTEEDLFKCDLIPFKNAVEAGVSFIMPAHIAYPEISGQKIPATISKDVIKAILRDELGFKGLVISDSFRMEGIGKSGHEAETSALSINSGCDIILDPKDPESLIKRLKQIAQAGELNIDTIDESVSRVIQLKNKWLSGEPPQSKNVKEDSYRLVKTIAERSPCLLKGGAIKSDSAFVYIFDLTDSGSDLSSVFISSLADAGIKCGEHKVSGGDSDSIVDLLQNFGAAVCLVLSTVGAYRRPPVLPESYRACLKAIESLQVEKVLVSLGSPYLISEFCEYDTVLTLFDTMDACQRAAAEVLTGKLEAMGKIPVKL